MPLFLPLVSHTSPPRLPVFLLLVRLLLRDLYYRVVPDDELQEQELARLLQNRVTFILLQGTSLSARAER